MKHTRVLVTGDMTGIVGSAIARLLQTNGVLRNVHVGHGVQPPSLSQDVSLAHYRDGMCVDLDIETPNVNNQERTAT